MILRGYYYGYDEKSGEHVLHVLRIPTLGDQGQPAEVRLPRTAWRGSDPGQTMSFGDACEIELRPGHSEIAPEELPVPRATGGRVR